MNPYSRAYSRAVGMFMLAAEGTGGGGGTTLKDQLAAEQSAHEATKTKLTKAENDLSAANTSVANLTAERDREKTRADKAEKDLKAEQDAHGKTIKERDDLKAEDRTADNKAREQLARNGIAPGAKETPEKLNPDAGDPVALWDEYSAADSTKQSQMRAKHGTKLDEAAVAWDKAQTEARKR